ncbi:hypothetical protein D3C78_1358610 [compost metagenome]
MPAVSDTTVLRGNPSDYKFAVFHLCNGTLCAAECVNSPGEFLAAKKAIVSGVRPDVQSLRDTALKLSDIFAANTGDVISAAH